MTMNRQGQITSIMNNFNFHKMREMMLATGWEWCTVEGMRVPDIGDLRRCAEGLLNKVETGGWIQTGGFEVSMKGGILTLRFIGVEWEGCDED